MFRLAPISLAGTPATYACLRWFDQSSLGCPFVRMRQGLRPYAHTVPIDRLSGKSCRWRVDSRRLSAMGVKMANRNVTRKGHDRILFTIASTPGMLLPEA